MIRRAGSADGDAVADVWWRARQASIPAIPAPVHPLPAVRSWLGGLAGRSGTVGRAGPEVGLEVWVATRPASSSASSGVAAVLVLEGAELDQLYVDPDHAGRGIGSRLVAHAKHRRPDGLTLWTFQANDRARAFYRRHGFVEGNTTDGDNEEHAPDIRLTWHPGPQ